MCPAIQPCSSNSDSACQKRQQIAAPENVAASFDQLSQLLKTKTRHGGLTVALLPLGSRAISDAFMEPAIARLMVLPCTPEQRQERVHDALRKHGYAADFVRWKAWV